VSSTLCSSDAFGSNVILPLSTFHVALLLCERHALPQIHIAMDGSDWYRNSTRRAVQLKSTFTYRVHISGQCNVYANDPLVLQYQPPSHYQQTYGLIVLSIVNRSERSAAESSPATRHAFNRLSKITMLYSSFDASREPVVRTVASRRYRVWRIICCTGDKLHTVFSCSNVIQAVESIVRAHPN